jgi:dihydrofolate reductase
MPQPYPRRRDEFRLGRRSTQVGRASRPGCASTTLTEPSWANTTVLSGDLAAAVGELKDKPGGELQVHGSATLIRWLLAHDLVDEMTLLTVPVVLGQGARLFPPDGPRIAFDLVESHVDTKGVTIQTFRPAA